MNIRLAVVRYTMNIRRTGSVSDAQSLQLTVFTAMNAASSKKESISTKLLKESSGDMKASPAGSTAVRMVCAGSAVRLSKLLSFTVRLAIHAPKE